MLVEHINNTNRFRNNVGAMIGSAAAQDRNQVCASTPDSTVPVHFEGWNYLFVDGHVKWLKPEATINGLGKTGGTVDDPKGMWTVAEND
jgi:prepilin-type processing-associated H-X9-DG protein